MATTMQDHPSNGSYHELNWRTAIPNYLEKLGRGELRIQEFVPQNYQISGGWKQPLQKLEVALSSLNDFATALTSTLAKDCQFAAVIWGSIKIILKLANPVFHGVLKMLSELGNALPKPRQYEQGLQISPSLEKLLFTAYTEIMAFYARSIILLYNNPNITSFSDTWSQFSGEFPSRIENLHRCSSLMDKEAEMTCPAKETKGAEIAESTGNTQLYRPAKTKLRYYMVPYGLNAKFFGRFEETAALTKDLQMASDSKRMGVTAIWGIGGVGKTQLALHYANIAQKLYDIILWIPADTQSKITQTVLEFAVEVGIAREDGIKDENLCIRRVKDWLNSSGKTFLLVFDNVERDGLLEQVWPTTDKGSIIITCRSSSVASKRTAKVMHLQRLDSKAGLGIFYSLTGLEPSDEADARAAEELLQIFGGLPVAIVQISEFLIDCGLSYDEFLPLFKKFAQRIFAKLEPPPQYGHTLGKVWEGSFERLSTDSKALLSLLSFFQPDLIPESILSNKKAGISNSNLRFLFDGFDFMDAVLNLKRASLVDRLSRRKALSVHPFVHFTAFTRLTPRERSEFLDYAVKLLFYAFPNTWNGETPHQGHGWASWETCGAVISHVCWLIKITQEQSLDVKNPEVFAELTFRAGTYFWEKEKPRTAVSVFKFGLGLDISHSTVNFAQAYRMLGHSALDIAQPEFALSAYQQALKARISLDGPNSPSVANIYDSIACSYTEQGDVKQAFEYLEKATDIHNANNPPHMSRTLAIYAVTYLRAGQPEKALDALRRCWELQNLTEEQVSQSKYPKHGGDIVLLSRIKYAQGLKEEARKFALRSISMRKGVPGADGPRVADSMFHAAKILEACGEYVDAAKSLQDIGTISQKAPDMQGHLARSLWLLSKVERKRGKVERAKQLKAEAKNERDKIPGREEISDTSDESFMSLVPWMLW